MNRTEWKAFCHRLRANARAFKDQHGGYPCMVAAFQHNGQEWSMTRRLDNNPDGWQTNTRKTLIRQRAWLSLHARALNECREYRVNHKRAYSPGGKRMAKIAIKSAVQEARETREASGWHRPHQMIDKSSRYAA